MFARNVALRLRPNSLNEFKRIVDSQIIPLLHKQPGFKDLITFALLGGTDVTVISLWETKDNARSLLGVPYLTVCAHSRHIQPGFHDGVGAEVCHSETVACQFDLRKL